MRQTT